MKDRNQCVRQEEEKVTLCFFVFSWFNRINKLLLVGCISTALCWKSSHTVCCLRKGCTCIFCAVLCLSSFVNEIKGLMLLSDGTDFGSCSVHATWCFSALYFENFVSPSAANYLSACLSVNLLNLTWSCRALETVLGAFLGLGLTAVQGIKLSKWEWQQVTLLGHKAWMII